MSSHSEFRNPHSALAYSAFRNPHSAIGNKGFTLIEIIIMIVMAGILLPAIIVPFVTGVRGSGKPEKVTTSMYFAHQRMEELMKFDYGAGTTWTTLYADIDPINFPNYQWQWEIVYVPRDNLNAVGQLNPNTGYKRIMVRVRDPELTTYEVYSVVTNFP
jgi:type II secretory pathway pseudopilin PulG